MSENNILILSGYKFVPIDNPERLQKHFLKQAQAIGIFGTILVGAEGLNMALAGTEENINRFRKILKEDARFEDIEFKESWYDKIPFRRMRVRLKNEIVTMRQDGIDPLQKTGNYLPAKEFKKWMDEGKDICILDTRNDYEYKIGSFENAIDPDIENFREFPEYLRNMPDEVKKKPVVMFCTGGIRCEKATASALEAGFEDVYQLEDGIIKYFEECGGDHWRGECFVFDNRVAVKPDLSATDKTYCLACLDELTEEDMKSDKFAYNRYCPHCYEKEIADIEARHQANLAKRERQRAERRAAQK